MRYEDMTNKIMLLIALCTLMKFWAVRNKLFRED